VVMMNVACPSHMMESEAIRPLYEAYKGACGPRKLVVGPTSL
jgi:hypothetical protein